MCLDNLALRQDDNKNSSAGIAILLLIFGIILMIYAGIPVYFILNLDPVHYILSTATFLSNALVLKNIIMFSGRIISFYCIIECVRTYTVFLIIVLGGVSSTYSIQAILLCNLSHRPCRYTLLFCRLSLLVHKSVNEAIEIFGGIALSVIFWAVSILIAIIVKKSSEIPAIIFGILLGATSTTLFAVFLCLHVVSSIIKISNEIVLQTKFRSRLAFTKTNNVKFRTAAKAIWYEAKAATTMKIQYKPFCNIDMSFIMTYVQNIQSRVFEMILIF